MTMRGSQPASSLPAANNQRSFNDGNMAAASRRRARCIVCNALCNQPVIEKRMVLWQLCSQPAGQNGRIVESNKARSRVAERRIVWPAGGKAGQ
ncbi:hypothetical protein NPIL_71021 [Nephila pilipes]|uniref:Uncharacterized protein n=1 Tax=Nephila pilipes TaxID=299642 RepID=A0A8X6MUJ1_NEPPI|nr:hypothetical protein NPIL_71021 [Nephila pilipes]